MNKRVLFSLLAILTLLLTACQPAAATPAPGNATNAPSGSPQRGGTLIIAYKDDLATLDPAIGYDWTNWPAEKLVFDGLLDYDAGTTLQPRLAASMPEVNADATVYTVKLRTGVKFSNGREFNADDV